MQPVREVYSLLMPIQDGRIIVPRAAVAEVMGYTRPKNRPDDAPAFLLGFIDWQGQKIPLVSYEAARGRGVPELGRRTRIAVVFGIAGSLQPDVFAVVTQGYPYLVRVNENVLQREPMEADEPLVLARVRMANEKPYIPDFEKLEQMLAESLGLAAPAAEQVSGVDELDAIAGEEEFDADLSGPEDVAGDDSIAPADDADGEPDFDLGDVTQVGVETSFSGELDALSKALGESGRDEDTSTDPAAVDLGDVTAFGGDTNYSAELDELSGALADDEPSASGPGDAGTAFDVSELEIDTDDADTGSEGRDDDAYDLSDLEFDVGDDEADK